jgi:adenylate cyclase
MSEVFISYARPDEERAELVATGLRAAGYEVWRDDELPAHRPYADVIEERLRGAAAVVVLWSVEAARSQWVRAEADAARELGTLVQARVDATIPPMPFNQIQCADLSAWDQASEHGGWRKLEASVAALAGPKTSGKESGRRSSRAVCICILPFQNMSGDAEQEYFSDGISEDITTDLSKVSALGVVARNTAFTFKGQAVNVCDVARKLGVTHVLEGSVRKAGTRLRITAQLIDGETGDHVWADRYDRDLDDIFAVQDEISKAIVAALRVTLLPEEKKAMEQRGTTNVEAYKLNLLARQYWVTGNHGDPRREERVMRICGRAVQIDPQYSQAWALMAMAQSNLHYRFRSLADDGFAAAHAALSIDQSIAEAHLPMIRRLEEQHRSSEADDRMKLALQLGPDSWEVRKEAGQLSMLRGKVDEATEHFEKALEAMDSDFHCWALVSSCYRARKDKEKLRLAAGKMVSEAQKALDQDPSNGAALGIIAGGYAVIGETERAREWIDRAMLIDPDNLTMRYNFACILAAHLNDPDAALKLLGRILVNAPETYARGAETDPDFDNLRDDPRFQSMIADARTRLDNKAKATPAAAAARSHS